MSRRTLAAAGALSMLVASCAGLGPPGTAAADDAATAARRILVTVAEPRSGTVAVTGAPASRYVRRPYPTHAAVEQTLDQLAREYPLTRVEGWPIGSLGVYCEVFEVGAEHSVDEVVTALGADARVDLVQRMHLFETRTAPTYDDPYASLQWAVPRLEVAEAHRIATGAGVRVAVIDSGVDAHHPDLAGRIRIARNLAGRDMPADGEIHGTAVAGIIGSLANNHEGIVGVAPDVEIAALRACWSVAADASAAHCSSFTLARALEAALEIKPRVINLSLGGPFDPLLSKLIDEAIASNIIVIAAAAGPGEAESFPASHPEVLVARTADDAPAGNSPYLLPAPGTEILTTTPPSGYAFLSGNSLAAAHLTGVVALLLQVKHDLTIDEVATLLSRTTSYANGTVSIDACLALERLVAARSCPQQTEVASF